MKEKMETGTDLFRTEKIPKILLKIAPPVMLAQLIQAMYNIVDSFFVRSVFRKFADSAVGDLSAAAYHYCPGGGNRCRCQHVHGETVCAEIPAESRGGSGNRHGSGIHDLAYICGSRGRVYASLCHDKREVSGGDRGRGDLRADRLHRQYWRVFRGKLDESTPVQGKYAAPDDRPDRWRAD